MEWPSPSLDLNSMKNLWSIVKTKVYQGGKQYSTKSNVWDAITSVCVSISPDDIGKLTNTMDDRLVKVIERKQRYIHM